MKYRKIRAIISGGGTGGHIFPALSIANKLKELNPETEILFVGADGRMEMERVPAAGYEIVGLPVAGLMRKLTLSNLTLPFKVIKSVRMAKKVIRDFKPDIAIGVGGYASAPLLWAAGSLGIPTLIQEPKMLPPLCLNYTMEHCLQSKIYLTLLKKRGGFVSFIKV